MPISRTIQLGVFTLLITVLLFACQANENGTDPKPAENSNIILPMSIGGAGEVVILIEDALYDSDIGDSIVQVFRQPFHVLPSYEPIMDPIVVSYSSFDNSIQRYDHVVVVTTLSGGNKLSAISEALLGEELVTKLNSSSEALPYTDMIKKDVWAKGQTVFFIAAQDKETLRSKIGVWSNDIVEHCMRTDLAKMKDGVYLNGINTKLNEQLSEYQGFTIDIPTEYRLAKNEGSFVWLRKDEGEVVVNLFIDVYPNEGVFQNKIIEKRDELGEAHVITNVEGAYMTTDSTLGFRTSTSVIDGRSTTEMRGLWKTENGFMGGPFLAHFVNDEENNRAIYFEGFVFAPGEDKRDYIREVETIFTTLRFTE